MPGSFHTTTRFGYTGRMNVSSWTSVHLGVFWLVIAVFGLPAWLLLSMLGNWLAGRYPYQHWFGFIPIGLAFLVVFLVAAFGLAITWRWLDSRPVKTG